MNTVTHTPEAPAVNSRDFDLHIIAFLKARRAGLAHDVDKLICARIENVTAIVHANKRGEQTQVAILEQQADDLAVELVKNKADLAKLDLSIDETNRRLAQCAND